MRIVEGSCWAFDDALASAEMWAKSNSHCCCFSSGVDDTSDSDRVLTDRKDVSDAMSTQLDASTNGESQESYFEDNPDDLLSCSCLLSPDVTERSELKPVSKTGGPELGALFTPVPTPP